MLAKELPVSTAEELLVVADTAQRSRLAQQAVDKRWERPQVRTAVKDCIAAIQIPSATQRSHQLLKLVAQIRDVLSAGPLKT